MKYYKISEEDLLYLIESRARYDALEEGGIDTWANFREANDKYLRKQQDLYERYEDGYAFDFDTIAKLELDEYEEIKKDV